MSLEVPVTNPGGASPGELLSLAQAVDAGYGAYSTLRAAIADGSLPALRLGKRAIRIRRADLDARLAPVVSLNTDEESLKAWAKAKAAGAPPLGADSVPILVDAFADALAAKVGATR